MIKGAGTSMVVGLFFPFFLLFGEAFAQGDPRAGAKIFQSFKCGSCHGDDGTGQGRAAKALKIRATDWTHKPAMAKITDQYIKDIISKGGKALNKSKRMPGYSKKLKPADIENFLAYIRSLAK